MATKRRRAVKDDDGRNGNGNGDGNGSTPEMNELKSALDDLTAKVNRLVAMQSGAHKNDQ